jgi:hypothetical protein
MQLDTHELAWAAGFFDGEGCISVGRRAVYPEKGIVNSRLRLVVTVTQAHPQPLERFRRAVGDLGSIKGPKQNGPNGQQIWIWRTSSFEYAQATIAMLWRFLSVPKQAQARRCLVAMAEQAALPRLKSGPKPRLSVKVLDVGEQVVICLPQDLNVPLAVSDNHLHGLHVAGASSSPVIPGDVGLLFGEGEELSDVV